MVVGYSCYMKLSGAVFVVSLTFSSVLALAEKNEKFTAKVPTWKDSGVVNFGQFCLSAYGLFCLTADFLVNMI